MSQIRVTSAELRKAAEYLRDKNEAFKNNTGKLETQEQTLLGQWEGDAQKVFDSAFKSNKAKFDEFYGLINKYIEALGQIATKYDQAESKNADTAKIRS